MSLGLRPTRIGIGDVCALVVCILPAAPSAPARAQGVPDDLFVIKASRVITVSGEEFAPGSIVVEDGKITGVGSGIEYPPSAQVIDARGETVMPGLIHPRSRHGLVPYRRTGVHGDWNASSEVYLSQMRFDDLLEAGYTGVFFVPDGADIPGMAAVFRTGGADEHRKLLEHAYLRANPDWDEKGKENLRDAFKKAEDEIEKVKKAREEWEKKQKEKAEKSKSDSQKPEEKKEGDSDDASSLIDTAKLPPEQAAALESAEGEEKFEPPKIDPKYQPLVDLIQKKDGARLMVELFKASDLHHLDDVLKKYDGIDHVYYLGTSRQTDYHHIVDELGERHAEVVLYPWVHFLPDTWFRYNLMKELAAAGCGVSVAPAWAADRDEYLGIRERLADLVRAGLPRADALKALTQHPAKTLGLDKRLGSIEKDKDADLVFFGGDPLDPHAKVTRVMILGDIVWDAKKKGLPES